MGTDTAVLDRNPVSAPVSVGNVQPQGSLNKELGPAGSDLSEFLKPSGLEVTPSLSGEVVESGVEAKSDKPDLVFEHKNLVEHSGPYVPVIPASAKIVMPMSEEEIADKLAGQDDDSGKSLAKMIKKIIKKMMGGY